MQLKLFSNASTFGRVGYIDSDVEAGNKTFNLEAGAEAVNDYYNGMQIYMLQGPGMWYKYRVIDYNGVGLIFCTIDTPSTSTNNGLQGGLVGGESVYDMGSIPEEFAINDITIVYREKPIK